MLKIIALVTGAVLLLLAAAIAMRPPTFQVARSIVILAPPERVFPHVNDLHRWRAWNPFDRADPAMQISYDGAAAGVGARYAYAGGKAGAGRMTIVQSEPGRQVGVRAEFFEPMAAVNRIDFSFSPAPGGTEVTWTMTGASNFLSKAVDLFVGFDSLLGKEFARGLEGLKAEVERSASPAPAAP